MSIKTEAEARERAAQIDDHLLWLKEYASERQSTAQQISVFVVSRVAFPGDGESTLTLALHGTAPFVASSMEELNRMVLNGAKQAGMPVLEIRIDAPAEPKGKRVDPHLN